jgi:ribosome biogenesis SPOUT family RNA methylase Rps3
MKTIIEHLDEEVFPWSLIEYNHISEIVGKDNVTFTNLESKKNKEQLKNLGKTEDKSIKKTEIKEKFGKICLLDPKAEKLLSPEDADEFDAFLFGGVLGDHPMKGRTEKHFADMKIEKRNLGDKQMSTDTAVLVAFKILEEKKKFEDLDFIDELEIVLEQEKKEGEEGKKYSQILPYRYLVENGKPILPKGLIEYLQSEE